MVRCDETSWGEIAEKHEILRADIEHDVTAQEDAIELGPKVDEPGPRLGRPEIGPGQRRHASFSHEADESILKLASRVGDGSARRNALSRNAVTAAFVTDPRKTANRQSRRGRDQAGKDIRHAEGGYPAAAGEQSSFGFLTCVKYFPLGAPGVLAVMDFQFQANIWR
jgi:hypothetical protein